MAGGGGARAWQFLKRNADYATAWRAFIRPAPVAEDAPFPVWRQPGNAGEAARFGLLAWEDPLAADARGVAGAGRGPGARPRIGHGGVPGALRAELSEGVRAKRRVVEDCRYPGPSRRPGGGSTKIRGVNLDGLGGSA